MRLITLSSLSLVGSSGIAEIKIPLWWADGTYVSSGGTTSAGGTFLQDGNSAGNNVPSAQTLHTLNTNWPASTKFALEVTFYSVNTSSTAYATLWDKTSNTQVASTQVSTTSTTATVVRSGQFTLTPGHGYGVAIWSSNTSYPGLVSDASLIVFP